ncbi:hypothetical protein HHI36_019848 [Cryptolaemus montrouzieri]|uniref:Uncharacterized protein n=1 Tax=Cryptolaemus montrouzieri TaxID=559131 RepID=A0ABD2N8K5_9CUCU
MRVTPTSSILINYTLSNNVRDAQLAIIDDNIGDHRLQILHINSPVESRDNTRSRCEINELDRIAFRDKLHAMQATEWTNPDGLCNEITRAFTISQSKIFLKNRFRNNSAPWFYIEIYELLRERDFHYKRHKLFLARPHLWEAYGDAQLALKKAIVARNIFMIKLDVQLAMHSPDPIQVGTYSAGDQASQIKSEKLSELCSQVKIQECMRLMKTS